MGEVNPLMLNCIWEMPKDPLIFMLKGGRAVQEARTVCEPHVRVWMAKLWAISTIKVLGVMKAEGVTTRFKVSLVPYSPGV